MSELIGYIPAALSLLSLGISIPIYMGTKKESTYLSNRTREFVEGLQDIGKSLENLAIDNF